MHDTRRQSSPTAGRGTGRLDAVLAAALVALCAAVVAGFAWTQPARTAWMLPYTQIGQLSYSAPTAAGSPYGSSGLSSGQPVYASAVTNLVLTYSYRMQTTRPVVLAGTEQLVATVSDGTGLTRTIPLQAPAQFARPTFTAVGTLNMADVAATAVSLTQGTGASGTGTVTVSIAPSVKAAGRLAGHRLQLQFDRPVVFSYTAGPAAGAATLSPSTLSDGSSAPGSLTSGGAPAPLVVTSGGSLLVPDAKWATFFRGIPVVAGRFGSLLVLVGSLGVALVLGRRLLRDANSEDESVRIATRHGPLLVEVDELPRAPTLVVKTSSFEGLLQVARRLECPILHHHPDDSYAVVDNGTLYHYCHRTGTRPSGTVARSGNGHSQGKVASTGPWVTGSGVAMS